MDPPAPMPTEPPATREAGWQVFFVRAIDALEPATESPVHALRGAGFDIDGLRVFELCGEPAAPLHAPLADARRIAHWLFSSPAAVRHLQRIDRETGAGLFAPGGVLATAAARGRVFAPGPGTTKALAGSGVEPVTVPPDTFDSEGILALPALAEPLSDAIAVVGAAGGRGLLQDALAARGATVMTLHVYRREPAPPTAAQLQRLAASTRPLLVATSLAALQRLPQVLAGRQFASLCEAASVVVASRRIAAHAHELGFRDCHVAGSAMTADLEPTLRRAMAAGSDPADGC